MTIAGEPSSRRAASSVARLLEAARAELVRLSPGAAFRAVVEDGAALIDIRTDSQIRRDGAVPGASRIERNVLEWRLEPGGEHSIPALAHTGRQLILLCDEGFQSSLATVALRELGLDVTDVDGGFQAWRQRGLAVLAPDQA